MQPSLLTSLQEVEKLWFAEKQSSSYVLPQFEKFFDDIGFTENYLTRSPTDTGGKVVKDIIWGMISLDSCAVALLNTPILQRLRYIKQLGFSHYVYPTATHTRFEHSLGVHFVAKEYLRQIGDTACERPKIAEDHFFVHPNLALVQDVQHAALLHDIGHFPCSHVMEKIVSSASSRMKIGNISVDDFLFPLIKNFRENSFSTHLSEVLAIAIILSPRFKRFYNEGVRRGDQEANYRIAALVGGVPLDVNYPAAALLISGPVDCDKIDYLRRDADLCNVPIGIDSTRLFLQSAFVSCRTETLPETLVQKKYETKNPVTVLVLNSSGIDTVEEAAFGRARLYERVYRHPITRNAERMLARAIHAMTDCEGCPSFAVDALECMTHSDDSLLRLIAESSSNEQAATLGKRLLTRNFPKRAIAFGPNLIRSAVPLQGLFRRLNGKGGGPARSVRKQLLSVPVEQLKEDRGKFKTPESHDNIECIISERAEALRDKLVALGSADLPHGRCEVQVIPLPNLAHVNEKAAVLERDGRIASSADYTKADELVSADEVGKTIGYVTCEIPWRNLVFLAAKEILYELFERSTEKLRLDDDITIYGKYRFLIDDELAIRRSKLNRASVLSLQSKLSAAGHFDHRPRLDTRVSMTVQIEQLATKFSRFDGESTWQVTANTIQRYVEQIPHRFHQCVLDMLDATVFLGREGLAVHANSAINKVLSQSSAGSGKTFIAPLSYNSGALVTMLLEQDTRQQWKDAGAKRSKTIHEALGEAEKGDTLILLDDNVSSGVQALSQLLAWLDVPRADWPTMAQQEHGIEDLALTPNQRKTLLGLNVWLAVCVGNDQASQFINVGLSGHLPSYNGLAFDLESNSASAQSSWHPPPDFKDYLIDVGTECLTTCRSRSATEFKQNEIVETAKRDAFGYLGAGANLVTIFNVPTSTVTALWCPGEYRGDPWFPLFIRRGYLRHLTVA